MYYNDKDRNIQAPWVGKTPEEYYGLLKDEEYTEEFDEDFAYEIRRDELLEEELFGDKDTK